MVAILLALMSVMSFVDRQVLAILATDMRHDLNLTDVQLGWLMGPAFFIVYNLTLLPTAFLVDRWNRKRLIVIGVSVWSLLTIGSGFAETYQQLLWLRAGVAFGEALLGPAAISLIGDLFERNDRPLPTAIYVAGSTIGSTGSALISTAVLQWVSSSSWVLTVMGDAAPWRLTLIWVGAPGLLLTLLFVAVTHEPVRAPMPSMDAGNRNLAIHHLKQHGSFYLFAFSALALLLMNMASIGLWAPTFFVRHFELSPIEAGYRVGFAALIGGVAGTIVLPTLIRSLIRKQRVNAMVNLVLGTIAVAMSAAYLAGNSDSAVMAAGLILLFMFCAGAAGTMPTLIVQLYTPSFLRGRLSALIFFIIYLLGFGLAPVLVPALADYLYPGTQGLGNAIATLALISGLLSLLLFSLARKGFHRAEAEHKHHA